MAAPVPRAAAPHADPGRTLEAEVVGYDALLRLIAEERRALVAADPDAVAAVTKAKAFEVDALRHAARERIDALRNARCTPDAAGMAAWAASPACTPRGRAAWAELTRLAAEAREGNRINGRLILLQQRHWDSALAALWQAAGIDSTYGADGRTRPAPRQRTFAAI